MTTNKNLPDNTASKVPSSRLGRLSQFGGLAAKVLGNVALEGAKKLSQGQRPKTSELLLTPSNLQHLAKKLSHLRGAAMKLGQMLSMDAGELLSPELAGILERLRSDASPMPHKQLLEVLQQQWGEGWLDHFSNFELRPFAAASIGQVHLANLACGQKLAVKVQYPGVKQAISSDVDNVASLLKISGLLPPQLDIKPLLNEAKKQLEDEADYQLEADYLNRYSQLIDSKQFAIPSVHSQLVTDVMLPMSFIDGVPIEATLHLPQATRNSIVQRLIALFMAELFDFKLMQSDPNFANFQYQQNTDKIVLLDFGATRRIPQTISEGYKLLINGGVNQDNEMMLAGAKQVGFFADDIDEDYLNDVLTIFNLACEPIRHQGEYDFSTSNLAQRVKEQGMNINRQKAQWHTPPVDALFIHRKLGGLYLLANKLQAKINVAELFIAYKA
ncbi:AarF/ABC1/UbiB kinase family protein [Paraferrimonas sp. SM1919]|uniref:ABC1 kinase family protein n=1 Tax=Paraferrimonas sp. SM1919 TaxID=2662263 RepID=UPI001F09C903|nr:AarF/ABC1/UbiB kinase family protein [Paraferrimonas sp. SM1919]